MKRSPPAASAAPALEQYLRCFDALPARYTESSASPMAAGRTARWKRYEVHPLSGQGWTDLHEFGSGLMIGRMHCRYSRTFDDPHTAFPDNLRLGIRLGGHSTLLHGGCELDNQPGDVLVRNADPGPLRNRIPSGSLLTGIAIDIPRAMLDTLRDQGTDVTCLGSLDSCAILRPTEQASQRLRCLGMRMLGLQVQDTPTALIELESLGLDLLLGILSAHASRRPPGAPASKHWLTALDTAMDILHAEWNQPLTISALARRAGMNECYLKALFRQRTGQTIAGYLRSLRMHHARDMVESRRYSVRQVAHFCGYLHAGKFSQAFRREHGLAPSELL